MTQCMVAGSKRRGSRTRKMRGGNMYGAEGPIAAGAMQWGAVANLPYNPATGGVSNVDYAMPGGRRRRGRTGKSRKGRKHGRRHTRRRRTMRGGGSYVGSANAGYSYGGSGVAGMANYGGYGANLPGAGSGHSQVAGVWQTS